MQLSKQVSLDCNSLYSISQISYTSGTLTLIIDYSEDLEGRDCTLEMAFDPNVIASDNATLSFQAVSDTLPLVISQNIALIQTISFIFQALAYISLGLLVVSAPHKMIGAEVITVFQIVYLSSCFYSKTTVFSYAIETAAPTIVGWPFFRSSVTNKNLLSKVLLSTQFL